MLRVLVLAPDDRPRQRCLKQIHHRPNEVAREGVRHRISAVHQRTSDPSGKETVGDDAGSVDTADVVGHASEQQRKADEPGTCRHR